jgi:hypothetical protein
LYFKALLEDCVTLKWKLYKKDWGIIELVHSHTFLITELGELGKNDSTNSKLRKRLFYDCGMQSVLHNFLNANKLKTFLLILQNNKFNTLVFVCYLHKKTGTLL